MYTEFGSLGATFFVEECHLKGVILAAGKGTRLYPVTHHVPKPLLEIADICVVVGEMGPQMRKELGDGSAYGIRLSYATQTVPKGLAHAVGCAKEFVGGDSFVLYLGDAIYSQGFQPYARHFRESRC